jgi:hypothetical protein
MRASGWSRGLRKSPSGSVGDARPHVSGPPPHFSRFAGASGALLLQGALLFLFLYSMPRIHRPVETVREMMLVFRHPALPPPPPVPEPERQAPLLTPAPLAPAPLFVPLPSASAPSVFAVPDLKSFGEALNGCAPEIYYRLTPEKQALCPHPGGSMAQGTQIDIAPRSHAGDAVTWQEDWDEQHWAAGLCDPSMGLVALCQIHQAMSGRAMSAITSSRPRREQTSRRRREFRMAPAQRRGLSALKERGWTA